MNSENEGQQQAYAAPLMSHQTSQQTVTQQNNFLLSTPTMNFMSTFDPTDDEMEGRSPHDAGSYHVISPFLKSLICSHNITFLISNKLTAFFVLTDCLGT